MRRYRPSGDLARHACKIARQSRPPLLNLRARPPETRPLRTTRAGLVVSHYEGLGHHAAFYVGCISDHPTLPKQTDTSRPAAPAASGHAAATPPRLLHWHERDLRYAGSSPSSSGMWRCPRRCRRLSAPNSASTDAVISRIALSTPSLVPSSAKAAASTDESAARSSRCDRCRGSILIMALASASARLRASSSLSLSVPPMIFMVSPRPVDVELVHQLHNLLALALLLRHQLVVALLGHVLAYGALNETAQPPWINGIRSTLTLLPKLRAWLSLRLVGRVGRFHSSICSSVTASRLSRKGKRLGVAYASTPRDPEVQN